MGNEVKVKIDGRSTGGLAAKFLDSLGISYTIPGQERPVHSLGADSRLNAATTSGLAVSTPGREIQVHPSGTHFRLDPATIAWFQASRLRPEFVAPLSGTDIRLNPATTSRLVASAPGREIGAQGISASKDESAVAHQTNSIEHGSGDQARPTAPTAGFEAASKLEHGESGHSAQPSDKRHSLDSKGSNSTGSLQPTSAHDEKAEFIRATEQASIVVLCAEIEDLTKSIVTELQSIKAKTGETDWDFFHKNIGIVASLGASITFALILTDIKDPRSISRHGWIDLSTVRIILATSWILFMTVLSLSFSVAQHFKPDNKRDDKRHNKGFLVSYLVYLLEMAAVMCLAFVVAAYVEVIGYVGMVLVSIVVVVIVLAGLAEAHLDKMNWQINIQSP